MTSKRVTRDDINLLKQHLLTRAPSCVKDPKGLLVSRFTIPTYNAVAGADDHSDTPQRSSVGHYLQMYDWDACLFSQAAHRFGFEGLPLEVVSNFLALQLPSGFIPRTVSPHQIWDKGDLCKPFLSQTLVAHLDRTGWTAEDKELVRPWLPKLERYVGYFQEHRRHSSGLYQWRNVLESGVDNNLALLAPQEALVDEDQTVVKFPDNRLLAVDLSSYMVLELRSLARLLEEICSAESHAAALRYRREADAVVDLIESTLWDEELGIYVNVDPQDGRGVRLRCWTGLIPALLGIACQERTERVIGQNVLNEAHFLRPFGIASMAASELLANQSPRGLYGQAIVCNWQGPVWVLPNVLVVRMLLEHGLTRQGRNVARRLVAALVKDLRSTGVLHENYHADTAKPLWAPQFMSWNILALELIELLESPVKAPKK